jgi:hypothetical protein
MLTVVLHHDELIPQMIHKAWGAHCVKELVRLRNVENVCYSGHADLLWIVVVSPETVAICICLS